MTDREKLERRALDAVSADIYYELTDSIDALTDQDLLDLIAADGDTAKEQQLA